MSSPGIFVPMFRCAGDEPNQMAYPLEVETARQVLLDHFADQGGLGPFLGNSAPPQRFALRFGKADGKSRFHPTRIGECKTNCKTGKRDACRLSVAAAPQLSVLGYLHTVAWSDGANGANGPDLSSGL